MFPGDLFCDMLRFHISHHTHPWLDLGTLEPPALSLIPRRNYLSASDSAQK
jgi:hypothetical protein